MSEKFKIGADITSFENNGTRLPISRVTLYIDDETVFTSGNDTGSELSARCDFATQEMADSILAQVQGFAYTAYSAGAANLDPAAELGDGATVGGVYSVIARVVDDGMGYPDIEAPGEKEVDEEFPFESPTTQEMRRKLAETRAQLKVTTDEIIASVESLDNEVKTTLRIGEDGVTITDADGGEVVISGGQVDASTIKAEDINAANLNLTGLIAFSDLNADTQDTIENAEAAAEAAQSTASAAQSTAEAANSAISRWTYPGTTEISGYYIRSGTVTASTIQGGTVEILGSNGSTYGELYAGANRVGTTALEMYGSNGMRLTAGGNIFLNCSGDAALTLSGSNATIGPNLYLSSGTQITSDRKKKKDIQYMDDLDNAEVAAKYDVLLDLLKFARFKYIDGTSDRYHTALIADDVETAIEGADLTTQEVAAFCKIPIYATDENGNPTEEIIDYTCALRYDEFTGMLIRRAQQLTLRTTALEAELAETKNTLLKFEERLAALGV